MSDELDKGLLLSYLEAESSWEESNETPTEWGNAPV